MLDCEQKHMLKSLRTRPGMLRWEGDYGCWTVSKSIGLRARTAIRAKLGFYHSLESKLSYLSWYG